MNFFKTFILLTVLTALFLGFGHIFGGREGMVIAFGFAIVMNFVSYWFSDKIVLALYRAKPAPESNYPQLYRIVRNLSQVAQIPMPKIYVVPQDIANAFANSILE